MKKIKQLTNQSSTWADNYTQTTPPSSTCPPKSTSSSQTTRPLPQPASRNPSHTPSYPYPDSDYASTAAHTPRSTAHNSYPAANSGPRVQYSTSHPPSQHSARAPPTARAQPATCRCNNATPLYSRRTLSPIHTASDPPDSPSAQSCPASQPAAA